MYHCFHGLLKLFVGRIAMPDETFDIILKVHVRAPFRLIRAAAPYLRIKDNKENRSIVNVSSTTGLHGNVGKSILHSWL